MNRQTLLASTAVALLMCSAPALAQTQQKAGEEKASPSRPSGSAAGEQQQKQPGARSEQGQSKAATHSRESAGSSAESSSHSRGETQLHQKGGQAAKGASQSRSERGQSQSGSKGAQVQPEQKGGGAQHRQGEAQTQQEQRGGGSRAQPKGVEAQPQQKSGAPQRQGAEMPSQQRGARTQSEQRGGTGGAGAERSGEMGKAAARGRGGAMRLSEQQRTSVHQTLLRERDVNRLGRAEFAIKVGTRVPRSVRIAVLPAAVIALVPQYREYRYFIANDEICIVDPGTFEIVDVIGGPSQAARIDHGATHQGLSLTREEREIVMRNVELNSGSTLGLGALSEGAPVPRDVRLRTFPAPVVRDVPKLQGYRYFTAENRVAIVDPQDDRVALVIRE